MIDCSITKNYLAEKLRMTKKRKRMCEIDCDDCPLNSKNNGVHTLCKDFESLYPDKAIMVVQKWSDEHPPKTYLSEFLKHYPNVKLNHDGTPEEIYCPQLLGLMSKDDCKKYCDCADCWNQPVENDEEGKKND